MLVLEVPEEQVPVAGGVDFDVSVFFFRLESVGGWCWGRFVVYAERKGNTHPACIFISGPSGCPGRDLTKYCAALIDGASVAARTAVRSEDEAPNRRDDATERILTD